MQTSSFLFLLLMALSPTTLAQSFVKIGSQWFYSENAEGFCEGNCEYVHLESIEDTVINGKTTHKIEHTYFKFTGDIVQYDPVFMFEESDTVFTWNTTTSKFLTTYIFNGNIGDTLILDSPEDEGQQGENDGEQYRLVIDTIINVNINGLTLKKYKTTALDEYQFYNGGYFMDRIGGLDWFLPRALIIPEAGGPIRCYSDAEIDSSFQDVACDYIQLVAIEEQAKGFEIEIFPNPSSGILTLKTIEAIKEINMYNFTGELVYTTTEHEFDISKLQNGAYIVEVQMKDGKTFEKKIIKEE